MTEIERKAAAFDWLAKNGRYERQTHGWFNARLDEFHLGPSPTLLVAVENALELERLADLYPAEARKARRCCYRTQDDSPAAPCSDASHIMRLVNGQPVHAGGRGCMEAGNPVPMCS